MDRNKDERLLATVVENMPAGYKKEEVCIWLFCLIMTSEIPVSCRRSKGLPDVTDSILDDM